jgi:hypothetical protein
LIASYLKGTLRKILALATRPATSARSATAETHSIEGTSAGAQRQEASGD